MLALAWILLLTLSFWAMHLDGQVITLRHGLQDLRWKVDKLEKEERSCACKESR
jgi:hypothetical protein